MTFANIKPIKYSTDNKETTRKTEFMKLSQGSHTIRILEPKAKDVFIHYIVKYTVLCLGDECPICANNRRLINDFPLDFRKSPGYVPAQERHFVNVLDKTLAKVCPKCNEEHKDTTLSLCVKCSTYLPEASPLNKVKVLAKGPLLFEPLEILHKSILDQNNNPIGINNFDVTIVVSGSGRDVSYTPIPHVNSNAPTGITPEMLFDLDKAVVKLNPEELLDLQRGISLKDIFSARRAKENVESAEVSDDVIKQINSEVSALFQR